MSKTLRSRPGFTLIELLVVIAIIAVLMGLVIPGVMIVVVDRPAMSQCQMEIGGLKVACQQFRAKFGTTLPSSLVVSSIASDMQNDSDTADFLVRAWPRIDFVQVAASMKDLGVTGKTTLEGDQCMVLLLGGPPDAAGKGATGFASNPRNPFDAADKQRTRLFEFPAGRLVKRNQASPFLSFKDPWGGVYAYFSSGRRANGYNETHCATLGAFPYFETPPAVAPRLFMNPNSCQIISAGKNQMFGPGGFLNLASPAINAAGADDVTNFAPGILAAGQGG